jgi:hypothetical protein
MVVYHCNPSIQETEVARPVILSTQETEIRRIEVQSQPGQIVRRDNISKKKQRAGGVVQDVGLEFKLLYHKKKKKKEAEVVGS